MDLFTLFFLFFVCLFICLFFIFSLFLQESTRLSRELSVKYFEYWCPARVCFEKWNRDWEAPYWTACPTGGCVHRPVSGVNDGNYTYKKLEFSIWVFKKVPKDVPYIVLPFSNFLAVPLCSLHVALSLQLYCYSDGTWLWSFDIKLLILYNFYCFIHLPLFFIKFFPSV